MANKTVVRNQAYTRGSASIRQRHNERENESYSNADIRLERSPQNVHFRQCEGTYTEAFDKLLADGIISTRGLQADAKIIDEMVFDVNTSYFEENGGYEFAKVFYKHAYDLAVKEVGDERYILSAVMHADEVNKAVSETAGKDVYHYHLHVVYIPIVEKEVKWTKRCKDPALVGTVKETIQQVSHSKKWWKRRDENGEWINSYTLLQDRYFEYMKEAGFKDFERGERGSTTEHLSDLEYKTKKEAERAVEMTAIVDNKKKSIAVLDEKVGKKNKQLAALDKKLSIHKGGIDDLDYLDNIGKNVLGQVILTPKELKKVKSYAVEAVDAKDKVLTLENQLERINRELNHVKSQRDSWKRSYEDLLERTKTYISAIAIAPQKIKEFLTNIIQEHKLMKQAQRALHKERSRDYGDR